MAYQYSKQVEAQQKELNKLGAGLKVDGLLGPLTKAAITKYETPTTNITPNPIKTPTPASDLTPTPDVPLPNPEAGSIYENYTSSLTGNVANIRKTVEDTYKNKISEIQERRKTLESEQKESLNKIDPSQRETFEKEKVVRDNELRAAATASGTIEQDFMKRRSLTSELEGLLNRGNALIEQQKGQAVGQGVINKRLNTTMTDISARAGVIEAVFSALDGNISQAYNIINQAKDTVAAEWKDNLSYYNTLLDLNNNKILNLDKEEKEIAEKQVALIEGDMTKMDDTIKYLQDTMIDPESAQFIADAGIKLTDSIEEINNKMAAQSRIKEVNDMKNEMVQDGYVYVPFPGNTDGLIGIEAGGKTLYFKDKSASSKKTNTSNKVTSLLSPTKKASLISAGMTLSDISNLESDVNTYGLDEALKGIDDEATKQAIRDVYGSEGTTTTDTDPETYIRDSLTTKELKKLSDNAGTSKWWRGKAKDINAFFSSANTDQLAQIKTAIEQGYTVDEIISFLNE